MRFLHALDLRDIAAHLGVDRGQQILDLILCALYEGLNPAITSIPDPARDRKVSRRPLCRIAEAYALHCP